MASTTRLKWEHAYNRNQKGHGRGFGIVRALAHLSFGKVRSGLRSHASGHCLDVSAHSCHQQRFDSAQGGSPGHRGASTGVRQSNRVSIQRVILVPDVVRQILEQLPLREATMALVDAVTALRASELVALKWKHVGWDTGILQSQFALVEGELKETKSSNNPLPLAESVLQVLRLWQEHTPHRSEEDWIFASPHYDGKTPYTYQILFRRHIRPVSEKISGLKSSKEAPIGWHTLRRSLATLLISNGENVKVAQSQLRHTTPKITLDLYAQAVSTDQQEAHKKVVQ